MKTNIPVAILALAAMPTGYAHAQQKPRQPVPHISVVRASAEQPAANGSASGFASQRQEPASAAPPGKLVLTQPALPATPGSVAADEELLVTGEAAKLFAAKVQPVLSNLCASCHARNDHASSFKLRPMPEGYANPQGVEHNMRMAAKFLSNKSPESSLLLSKSVAAHAGTREAPIFSRQHPAYRILETWAYLVVYPDGPPMMTTTASAAANPNSIQLAGGTARPDNAPPVIASVVAKVPGTKPQADSRPLAHVPGVTHLTLGANTDAPVSTATPTATNEPARPSAPTEFGSGQPPRPLPPRPTNPDDPFDPEAFNRLAHPPR